MINAPKPISVGLADVDCQHQELARQLKGLLEGIVSGNRSEVHRVIEFLQDYVVEHFGLEERRMAETGYPDLAAHKAEHDAFMREYVRLSVEVERKGATALVAMGVANWLATWLRRHVAGPDGALGRFLQRRSPVPEV